jgi:hypothetical protein
MSAPTAPSPAEVVQDGTCLALAIEAGLKAENADKYVEAVVELRYWADRATQTYHRVSDWWIADPPNGAPDENSTFEWLCKLGRRLACRAYAAGQTHIEDASFKHHLAESWRAGQLYLRGLAGNFDVYTAGAGLHREAVLIAPRPRHRFPRLLPYIAWAEESIEAYEQLPRGYGSLAPNEREEAMRAALTEGSRLPEESLDLNQIAALMHLKKSSMGRYKRRKNDPLPDPDSPGGGGNKDYWRWSTIRPWLDRNCRTPLPEHFPDVWRRR